MRSKDYRKNGIHSGNWLHANGKEQKCKKVFLVMFNKNDPMG